MCIVLVEYDFSIGNAHRGYGFGILVDTGWKPLRAPSWILSSIQIVLMRSFSLNSSVFCRLLFFSDPFTLIVFQGCGVFSFYFLIIDFFTVVADSPN